jgi:hypothetical protein
MPFVTFTVRRGLSATDKSRLSEAMLEAQVAAGYHRADLFHRFLAVGQWPGRGAGRSRGGSESHFHRARALGARHAMVFNRQFQAAPDGALARRGLAG